MSSFAGYEQVLPDWRELYARRTDRAAGTGEILRILGKDRISPEDLAVLLSPSAESCLEEMAVRARELTLRHFGRALHIYAPLYLADYCVNRCLYCGFSASRSRPRRRLERDEIRRQGEILADRGIRQILLLTGEDPRRSSVSYLEEAVSILAGRFGTIGIEVYPLDVEEYRRIIAAGADSMTVYQETYNRELYEHLHPAGPKRDYSRRLGTPERAGEAGFRQIGIGALLGLDDWRREVFLMALHGSYLQKRYPGAELSLSFPRLRPEPGGYRADYPVNDRNLVQALMACRLFLPRAGISLSTRESAALRDHLLPLGITRLSAGSSTVVGGYGQEDAPEEGQFETSDKRSIEEMREVLVSRGFQPVFQDRIGAAAGGRGMNETERILDVNLNRACEGLRVLEDMARFFLNREDLTEELKVLRHRVRKIPGLPYSKFLEARNAAEDPGPVISAATGLDGKEGLESLLRANFRRAQEALRCAEEMAKAGAGTAGRELEQCRFVSYDLEKRCLAGMFRSRFIRPFRAGGLYGLTDSLSSRGRSNEEMVRIMTGEGIRIIQYREKDLSQRERFRECEALRRITEEAGAVFIVNDHIDLALAAGADGVHLGQDDLSMEQARALCGDRMIIGRSTHSPEQARQAVLEGADYIGVGPVYATKTKRDVCDPVGLTYLDHVVRTHDIPFVAIGGIKARNMADVASQGARLIALVTEITGAEDPAEVIRQLRKIQLRSFTETETNKEFIHES